MIKSEALELLAAGKATHRGCGGDVTAGIGAWCRKCYASWADEILDGASLPLLQDWFTFASEPKPEILTYVVVWVPDPITQFRHSELRLLKDAEGLERVKA